MLTVYSNHVVIEIRSTSPRKVSKKEFNKSIDEVCNTLKNNADDIKNFVETYPLTYGHNLTIYQ